MEITWFGHSSFRILSSSGKKIITDPYEPLSQKGLFFASIGENADFITISHSHWDHSAFGQVSGKPVILDRTGYYDAGNELSFYGIKSFHDGENGTKRGENRIFKISMDGETVVHLGDLGHIPDESVIGQLKNPDVLIVPVGGVFTLDIHEAEKIACEISPKFIIPMHYSSPKCNFLKYSVDDFTDLFSEDYPVIRCNIFDSSKIPENQNTIKYPTIIILESIR